MIDPGVDVLGILKAASAELNTGELLHGDSFHLGAVMNATVIGDPRLDAGQAVHRLRGFAL